jgi:uncharacterized membrane protein
MVSLEAIFLSVFVLMSQNRMTRMADHRAHLDLQIDLLAERELTMLLRMLRALCRKHGVDAKEFEDELREMLEDTDVNALATDLETKLPSP